MPASASAIAIRIADPAKISSVTRSAVDSRAQVARVTVPNGDGLNGFGFEAFGEMATRLVARGSSRGFSATNAEIAIRGADALNTPLGRSPADLLSDLDHIEAILKKDPPPGLRVLEQLVPINKPRTLVRELEGLLATALADPDGSSSDWLGRLSTSATTSRRPLLSWSAAGRGGGSRRGFRTATTCSLR